MKKTFEAFLLLFVGLLICFSIFDGLQNLFERRHQMGRVLSHGEEVSAVVFDVYKDKKSRKGFRQNNYILVYENNGIVKQAKLYSFYDPDYEIGDVLTVFVDPNDDSDESLAFLSLDSLTFNRYLDFFFTGPVLVLGFCLGLIFILFGSLLFLFAFFDS